eukprot:2758496-Rhodomonas_salina.3
MGRGPGVCRGGRRVACGAPSPAPPRHASACCSAAMHSRMAAINSCIAAIHSRTAAVYRSIAAINSSITSIMRERERETWAACCRRSFSISSSALCSSWSRADTSDSILQAPIQTPIRTPQYRTFPTPYPHHTRTIPAPQYRASHRPVPTALYRVGRGYQALRSAIPVGQYRTRGRKRVGQYQTWGRKRVGQNRTCGRKRVGQYRTRDRGRVGSRAG